MDGNGCAGMGRAKRVRMVMKEAELIEDSK